MNSSLHILFLADGIHPFSIGGMQKHSSELIRGLVNTEVMVTLIFSIDKKQNIPEKEEILQKLKIEKKSNLFNSIGVHFPEKGNFPGHYLRESYEFSKMIFEIIEKNGMQANFVFAQGFSAWYLMEQKKKGMKFAPVGVHFHGLNMFQKNFGFKANLIAKMFQKPVKKNLQMADVVFSYGGKLKEVYRKLGVENKCKFQPIGTKLNLNSEKNNCISGKLNFVFIGRNDKVKGLDVLHKAINKIPEDKFDFYFIGDIPSAVRINRKDCKYYGIISDEEKEQILKNSDVLICSSYSEGMPYVILEAMVNGLAVLSTDVGAISEMVSSENGILIAPANISEMETAILKFSKMEKPELDKMKESSLKKAENFEWNKVISNLIKDICEISHIKLNK